MEPPKEKRVFTPEHLEKLRIAREKALVVRQKKAQEKLLIKNIEKEIVTKTHEIKLDNVKTKLDKLVKPPPVVESETESEPEIIVKKKKKKKSKKIVIVEDSDSDDEQQQVIFVKRTKPTLQQIPIQPQPQPQPQIQQPQPPQRPQRRTEAEIYAEHFQRNRRGF